mgnify:CR=1 FL=1
MKLMIMNQKDDTHTHNSTKLIKQMNQEQQQQQKAFGKTKKKKFQKKIFEPMMKCCLFACYPENKTIIN